MATKREGTHDYPAAAYLVVPDKDSPSTWKLRIWESSEKKITQAQLGRAAAALGPGFRGRKAELSDEHRRMAARTLRAMYREHTGEDEELPSVLKEALHADAMKRAKMAMPKAKRMKAMAEGEEDTPESLLAELVEAYHSMEYMMAVHDGELSYESVVAACAAALERKHKAEHMKGEEHPWSCSMALKATFPGACVYEMMGKFYQVSFEMHGTDVTMGTDDIEVTASFNPTTNATMHESRDLWEPWTEPREATATALSEARADQDRGVLLGAVLLNKDSVNGDGGKGREYTDPAMRQLAQLAEGLPAYANHAADKSLAFKPRDVRELIGVHRNVRFDAANHRVLSDLHIVEHHRPWVFGLAKEVPKAVGLSPVARGLVRIQNGKEIVEEILAVRSGDLVTDPATTKGLFESREEWRTRKEGAEMAELTVTSILEWCKDKPAEGKLLKVHLAGEEIKGLEEGKVKAEQELAAERAEHVKSKAELTEAKTAADGYKAAEALRDKQGRLEKAISESDLGKKYSSMPEAASPLFRQTLMEAKEETWPGLIEERSKLLAGAARSTQKPQSSGKDTVLSEGRESLPEGTHSRLANALR